MYKLGGGGGGGGVKTDMFEKKSFLNSDFRNGISEINW